MTTKLLLLVLNFAFLAVATVKPGRDRLFRHHERWAAYYLCRRILRHRLSSRTAHENRKEQRQKKGKLRGELEYIKIIIAGT